MMKVFKFGFLVILLVLSATACSTVNSSDSSLNVSAKSNRPVANKVKPKSVGQAMLIPDERVNDLIQNLYAGSSEQAKFDFYVNCANHPVCYKNPNDLLKPGRTQLANDLDHGGIYASAHKDGVYYYMSFREIPGANTLIVTISNQNREQKLPDYQIVDCGGDGLVDGRRVVDMKNVADPVDFQMSRNPELYSICDKIKPGEFKFNRAWQSHYIGALDSILSAIE